MKGHLALLVGVLVVHVVDDVHGVDVGLGQPGAVEVDALHQLVVVQVLLGPHGHFGAHLVALQLVPAAVDGQQHQLGQIGTGAEELHILANAHGGNAAGDGVVVAIDRAHHVVVLILEGVGVAGDLGGKALPVLRQVGAPQHGEVGLWRGPQVVQGLQHAEAGLGHQGTSVLAHAAHAFGNPHGVAAEQLVVLGGAQVAGHAQLQDKVVEDLLGLFLGEGAGFQIPLKVDIQEGGHPAQAHGGAVLFLDGGQIAEVQPLHGFLGVFGRAGDVIAVHLGHGFHVLQGLDLVVQLLRRPDGGGAHHAVPQGDLVGLLLLDKPVDAVQGHPAVVADDAPPAVGVGQAGDEPHMAGGLDLRGVGGEHAVVVGLVVFELLLNFGGDFIAIGFAGGAHHAHAAKGVAGPLQGLVGLQAHDDVFLLVQVAGAKAGGGDDGLGVHLQSAAVCVLLQKQILKLLADAQRPLGGAAEKAAVPAVGGIVLLDKVADVDLIFPQSANKAVPFLPFHKGAILSLYNKG